MTGSPTQSHPWLIIVCSFLTIALGTCIAYGTGMLYVALLETYQESVIKTSWLGAVSLASFSMGGPLASAVINTYTCRTCILIGGLLNLIGFTTSVFVTQMDYLFLTFGIISGMGQSLCYSAALVITGFYFEKKRSLATGIAVSGAGVGMLAIPPYTQLLLDIYGLKGTFLLLGATGFQVCVFGALMRPHSLERKRKLQADNIKISKNIFKRVDICRSFFKYFDILGNCQFLYFLISIFTWSFGMGILLLYLPSYFISRGSTRMEASFLMLVMGVGSIFSRVLVGLAAVEKSIGPRLLFLGIIGIAGVETCFLTFYTATLGGKLFYIFTLGLYTGGGYALLNSMLVDLLGIRLLASSFGMTLLICGLGFLAGPPITALLVGGVENYQATFILAGAMMILASGSQMLMNVPCRVMFVGQDTEKHTIEKDSSFDEETKISPVDLSCSDVDVKETKNSALIEDIVLESEPFLGEVLLDK